MEMMKVDVVEMGLAFSQRVASAVADREEITKRSLGI
jgi:hypothetical protein